MTLYGEILKAYRGIGTSMKTQLAQNPREERLLFYLVLATVLGFIARVPGLVELAENATDADVSIMNIIGTSFATALFYGPIALYGIAALSHIIAKIFKGAGSFREARLALFWPALVLAPLFLLIVALRVFIPDPLFFSLGNMAIGFLFVYFWGTCLAVAEKFENALLTILSIVTIFGLIMFAIRLTVLM